MLLSRRPIVVLNLLMAMQICCAQPAKVTYYDHVQPIMAMHCTPCHYPNGIGPFSLTTYSEVKSKGDFIVHVTQKRYMPPWKADPEFQHYKNQRILTEEEINILSEWVTRGMAEGKQKKGKAMSNDTVQRSHRTPDISLRMTTPFIISNQGIEDFRYFVLPTNLSSDVHIEAIEFIPGNKRQAHHSRVMADTTQRLRSMNGISEYDPQLKVYQKIPIVDEFLYGWVPGNDKIFFPEGTGRKLYKGTDLILNIHYTPSSRIQQDQSTINLYFTKHQLVREVKTLALREEHISNLPFLIPAGKTKTFYISYTVDEDLFLISVLPHMHFLGKSFRAFALDPEGGVIPLIKIDNWDFNWQTTYQFKELLKIPARSTLIVEATYDNTSSNPANPNHPPKDVCFGWNTTDEMCNLVMYYVDSKQ